MCYARPCNVALLCLRTMHGEHYAMQEEGLEQFAQGFLSRGFLFLFFFTFGNLSDGPKSDCGPKSKTCNSKAQHLNVIEDCEIVRPELEALFMGGTASWLLTTGVAEMLSCVMGSLIKSLGD